MPVGSNLHADPHLLEELGQGVDIAHRREADGLVLPGEITRRAAAVPGRAGAVAVEAAGAGRPSVTSTASPLLLTRRWGYYRFRVTTMNSANE